MKKAAIVLMVLLVIGIGTACTPTEPVTDPIGVVQAFHDAVNSGDIDDAMSYVADDVEFIFLGREYSGKPEVRDWYQRIVDRKDQYELSDIRLEDGTVYWTANVTSRTGPYETYFIAVVEDGKLVMFGETGT